MEPFEFFRWNVLILGFFVLIVILYLVVLINKRRQAKFLHKNSQQGKQPENPPHPE